MSIRRRHFAPFSSVLTSSRVFVQSPQPNSAVKVCDESVSVRMLDQYRQRGNWVSAVVLADSNCQSSSISVRPLFSREDNDQRLTHAENVRTLLEDISNWRRTEIMHSRWTIASNGWSTWSDTLRASSRQFFCTVYRVAQNKWEHSYLRNYDSVIVDLMPVNFTSLYCECRHMT